MSKVMPNFFIIGAPKCGTTALYTYLREHPQVFMPRAKEPHFFAEDFPLWRFVTTMEDYQALFSSAQSQHLRLGEASPWYLYSTQALARLKQHAPDAKLIVMLRDPVDMVYAQFYQNRFNLDEDCRSFDRALKLEESRKQGQQIPKQCRSVEMLYYSEMAAFASQLEAVQQLFPAEQVHVVLFDDFVSDIATQYRLVLEFLQLENDKRKEFPQINKNQTRSFPLLAQLSERPPVWAQKFAGQVRGVLGVEELGLYRLARSMSSRNQKRQALSSFARERLVEIYRPEVERLSEMLSRDLRHWCRPAAESEAPS